TSIDYVHAFHVVDINRDGKLDIVFAEMAQSTRKRVGIYAGDGTGGSWTLQVIATTGSHNIRLGDLGRDGDLDILGVNWQGPPVEIWINRLDPVVCHGDWDQSGSVDTSDVAIYVVAWLDSISAGSDEADMDGDGDVTPSDLAIFIGIWHDDLAGQCGSS
ncbi:MAG: VCBS repeat-containing protein, partial [Phycisphaeraceae bacterium]|nr:VCBS repeat-containing protein [Phycisphaeraceae bacterium]